MSTLSEATPATPSGRTVAARAVMTFSSVQHGRAWLIAENRVLGGVAPITLLDTDVGARAAEEVLIRMYPSDDI